MKLNKAFIFFVIWIVLSIIFVLSGVVLSSKTFCTICIFNKFAFWLVFALVFITSHFVVLAFDSFSKLFRFFVMLVSSAFIAFGLSLLINFRTGDAPKEENAVVMFPRMESEDYRSFEYNNPMADLVYENDSIGTRSASAYKFYMKVREGDTISVLVKRGGLGLYVLLEDEPISIKFRKIK